MAVELSSINHACIELASRALGSREVRRYGTDSLTLFHTVQSCACAAGTPKRDSGQEAVELIPETLTADHDGTGRITKPPYVSRPPAYE